MGQSFQLKIIGWFHRQSLQTQKKMNEIFQEYKKQVDECNVVFTDDLEVPFTVAPVELYVDERGKYNRAKKKQEDMRLIREYEELEK